MKMNLKTWVAGLLLVSVGMAVHAETLGEPQRPYERDFKFLDANVDGKLSAAEAGKEETFQKGGFAKADANHNGSLSQDEYATYKSAVQKKEVGRIASDSAITSKIKSKYLLEKGLKSFKVSVETKDGIVILSGFVNTQEQKTRAEQIAASVSGVKSVSSAIVVKP
jgi:hyperosmotically inducible periplasmic protein